MKKYHLDKNGNPAVCEATVRDCPVGGSHFTDQKSARKYYENSQTVFVDREDGTTFDLNTKVLSGLESFSDQIDYADFNISPEQFEELETLDEYFKRNGSADSDLLVVLDTETLTVVEDYERFDGDLENG